MEPFKNKLKAVISYSHAHLGETQSKKKNCEAHRVKLKELKDRDLALGLLPLSQQPLKSKFLYPYRVFKRTSNVNYIFVTSDRREKKRIVHVNLLKEYHSLDGVTVDVRMPVNKKDVAVVVPFATCFGESEQLSMIDLMLTNSHMLENIDSHAPTMNSLLGEYSEH